MAKDSCCLLLQDKIDVMKMLLKLLLAAMIVYLPSQSFAWGKQGHRIVGEIADSYLTAKARLALKEILGNETMAIASNWADFMRSDSASKYLDPWHYCNFEDGISKDSMDRFLKADTIVDAYTKLNFMVKELKANKQLSKEKKLFYVRMIIHIVGDMHQPLHNGRGTDWGANAIKLSWFNEQTNLHSVWDEKLVDFQQLSYTEYAKSINFCSLEDRSKWQKQPISDWVYESYALSRQIYNQAKQNQKLSYNYNYEHIGTVNNQLLKGGVRLAGLLNSIFG